MQKSANYLVILFLAKMDALMMKSEIIREASTGGVISKPAGSTQEET